MVLTKQIVAGLIALITTLALVAAMVFVPAADANATGGGQEKVGICHRTASETNPYVYIEVPKHEANGHITGDNKQHNRKVTWKSDGTWRGVAHKAGDLKLDYYADSKADCNDTEVPPPSEPEQVVPDAPGFFDECGPDNEVVVVPDDNGLVYTVVENPAGTYTVTVVSADEDKFVIVKGSQTKWVFTANDEACPVVTEPPVVTPPVVTPPVVTPPVPPVVTPPVTTPQPPKKRIKPSVAIRANCKGKVAYVANNKKSNVAVPFRYLNDGKVKKVVVKAGKKKVIVKSADNRSVVWIKTKGDFARTVVPGKCFVPHAGYRR